MILAPVVLATAGAVGCAPVINHGPAVRDGWSFHAGAGATYGLDCDPVNGECPAEVTLGVLGVEARYGEEGAYSVGVQLPVFPHPGLLRVAALDVYLQLPGHETSAYAKGVGLYLQEYQLGPYIQFGRVDDSGNGWHTTQALVWRRDVRYTDDAFARPGFYWVPSLTLDRLLDRPQDRINVSSWLRPFVSLGLGYDTCPQGNYGCGGPGLGWWLAAGATLEIGPRLTGR